MEATKASLLAEAGDLLRAGAAAGHGPACGRLARWHLFGVGGVPVDVGAAWDLCVKGWGLTEDPECAFWLGWMSQRGRGALEGQEVRSSQGWARGTGLPHAHAVWEIAGGGMGIGVGW